MASSGSPFAAALHFLSDLELLDTATPDARLCLQFGHKYAVGRRPEVPPAGATAVYVRTGVASRMHLLVSQHPTDLWLQGTPVWGVTDLGSMNGTWINGYRLPAHTWRELRHDDVINIGEKSALRWRVEQPLQPPAGAVAAAEAAHAPAASAPVAAAPAPSSSEVRSTTLGDWIEPLPATTHVIAPYGAQRTEAPQSFGDDPREVARHAAAAAKVAAVQAANAAAALAAASDGSAHDAAVVAAANAAAGAAAAAAESARHDAESAAATAYSADAESARHDAFAVQTDDDGDEDAVLLLDAPPPAGFPPVTFGDAPGGAPAMPTAGSAGRSAVTSRSSDELLADLAKSLVSAGAAGDGMHLLVGWTARYELRKEGNSAGQPQLLFFDTSGKRYELPQSPP